MTTVAPPEHMPVRVSAYEQGRLARRQGIPIHKPPTFYLMYNQQQWQAGWIFQDEVETQTQKARLEE